MPGFLRINGFYEPDIDEWCAGDLIVSWFLLHDILSLSFHCPIETCQWFWWQPKKNNQNKNQSYVSIYYSKSCIRLCLNISLIFDWLGQTLKKPQFI